MKAAFLSFALFFTFTAQGGKCEGLARRVFRPAVTAFHRSIDMAYVFHLMGQLVLMPQRKLAVGPGIEVIGSPLSSKESGEWVIQYLKDFDRAMKSLGLEKSTVTKIYVPKEKTFPWGTGLGAHFRGRFFNLWHASEADDLIFMRPYRHFRLAEHPLTLFHERGHSVLQGMYKRGAFVRANIPLQEGLVDFLAAHYVGIPRLKFTDNLTHDISRVPPLPLPTIGSHRAGAVFTYILWKLRERTGLEAMTSLLRPFLDGLNQYYESFARGHKKIRMVPIWKPEYNYFMAVLKRTLQEQGRMQEADEFIAEITTRLKLDGDFIDELAGSITKSNKDFTGLSPSDYYYSLFLNAGGVWVIFQEGRFIHWLYTLFF